MKKRWLALLLAASMLVPTTAGLISCKSTKSDTTAPLTTEVPDPITEPLTSARAVDKGDLTYYLDKSGTLYTSYGDHITKLAALSATEICIAGNTLWFSSGNTLSTYNLTDGTRSHHTNHSDPITSFALLEDKVYFLSTDKLYQNGELLLDCSSRHASDGASLASICDFELKSADEILLFLPNPHYQDEDTTPGYLLAEQNDTYITYCYKLSTDTLSPYDFNQEQSSGALTSTSGAITINGVVLPFADYPVGSYFTQNGGPCSCHTKGYCISNNKSWENCIRYWPNKSSYQVDLRGVQCMGFARFCQWRLYGTHDFGNTRDFYNAFGGKIAAGSWTANTVKKVLTEAGPGGHIRTGAGHSMFVISVTATGFVTYECNTNAKDCKIYTRQWTWDSFYNSLHSREILYYNMPRNVEINGGTLPEEGYKIGSYRVAADGGLNLRTDASTTSGSILHTIPNGTILQVTQLKQVGAYYWGYTTHDGQSGWVRLDYAVYQSAQISSIHVTDLPTKVTYLVGETFSSAGMKVEARFTDGTAFDIAGYSCSGYDLSKPGTYTVTVTYGAFRDTFTITVLEKLILPTAIYLWDQSLTLLVGDQYQMGYTLLPTDTTQKTIHWTSSDESVISVSEGVLQAEAVGSTTITAKTENGLTATCTVTVINMPTGTNWSTTADGTPLTSLPVGIESVDYSIRYRTPAGAGWSDWIYGEIPTDIQTYQCQFRSFTATFVNTMDGKTVHLFTVELNQIVNLVNYQLEADGNLFAGWYYDPQAAAVQDSAMAAPTEITITGDLLLYAGWIPLGNMKRDTNDPFSTEITVPEFGFAGTEVKVAGESTGIRYIARISTSLIATLESVHPSNLPLQPTTDQNKQIGFGMLIQMRSYANKPLVKAEDRYLYKGGTVTIPAKRTHATYNGYILFNAFVCGFTEDYYKTDFVGRPYLTYSDANGILHTHYFTYLGLNGQSGGYYTNLYAEAEKMVADPSLDGVTKKWLEDNILN